MDAIITGFHRSSTTAVARGLRGCGIYSIPYEFNFLEIVSNYQYFSKYNNRYIGFYNYIDSELLQINNRLSKDSSVTSFDNHVFSGYSRLIADIVSSHGGIKLDDFRFIYLNFLTWVKSESDFQSVIEKSPSHINYIDIFNFLFSDFKVIICFREISAIMGSVIYRANSDLGLERTFSDNTLYEFGRIVYYLHNLISLLHQNNNKLLLSNEVLLKCPTSTYSAIANYLNLPSNRNSFDNFRKICGGVSNSIPTPGLESLLKSVSGLAGYLGFDYSNLLFAENISQAQLVYNFFNDNVDYYWVLKKFVVYATFNPGDEFLFINFKLDPSIVQLPAVKCMIDDIVQITYLSITDDIISLKVLLSGVNSTNHIFAVIEVDSFIPFSLSSQISADVRNIENIVTSLGIF
jgi:hypothetical protein